MISDIRLQYFRSYGDETFEFEPSVNIIVGPNGSGKTNLLESILVLARGSSYRARDNELVQHDQPWARLDAHLGEDIRTVKIINEPAPGKTYEIDGRAYRRLPASKTLPVVLFEPNHLFMLSGPPDMRRNYLDNLIEQIRPGYGRIRRDYRRVLIQRNALLKRLGSQAGPQIFPWNVRLSELGGAVAGARQELLEGMSQDASNLYGSLADKPTDVRLRYETRLPPENYASALHRALEHNFGLDVARGFTGAGPHRDDLGVYIHGRPVQATASRGETRTAILMLKVMELRLIERLRSNLDSAPILLLDDVFSELDGKRRQALTRYLQDYQTFITTTDADVVVQHFMDRCAIIPL